MPEPLTVNVDLPDAVREAVLRRARDLQFRDLRFYTHWLMAKDASPESEDANLEVCLVKEGMASGTGRVMDESFYRELIEETDRIIKDKAAVNASRAAG